MTPSDHEPRVLQGLESVPATGPAAHFVGRNVERAQITASIEQVTSGDPLFVAITGEAGVGKTRLLAEALAASGMAAHWARCADGARDPAFWPLIQLLRSIRVRLGKERYLEAAGDAGVGLLEPLVAPAKTGTLMLSGLPRFRLFDRVLTTLVALARVEPLLLIVDDLHWADLSTLSLLEFLSQTPIEAPIGVFVTVRDHDADDRADALQRFVSHTTVIRMNRLNRRQTSELLAQVIDGPVGEGYADSAFDATGGNPHYVLEYAQAVAPGHGGVEQRLGNLTRNHLDRGARLDSPVREVVEAAAVLGESFDIDLLAEMVGSSPTKVSDLLSESRTLGLIAPLGENRLGFVHGLNREAVYSSIGAGDRQSLHAAAAAAYELRYRDDRASHAAAVAFHLANASVDADRVVVDRLIEAARAANDTFAKEEATVRYANALVALDRLAAAGEDGLADLRIDVDLELGEAHMSIAQADDARRVLRDAAAGARGIGDVERLARVALAFPPGLEGVAIAPAADPEQVALRQEALEALPGKDSALRAEVMCGLATCRYWTAHLAGRPGDFTESLVEQDRMSAAGLAMARRVGDRSTLARCVLSRLHAVWTPDHRDRAELVAELVELAESLGDLDLLASAISWQILEKFDQRRHREAEQLVFAYADLAERMGQPLYRRNAHQWAACLRVLRGDIDGGMQAVFGAMATTAALIGDENAVAEAAMLLSVQRFFTGDYEPLIEPARHVIASNTRTSLNWQAGLMFMLAETGELDEARSYFEALMGEHHDVLPRDINWLVCSQLLALTAVHLGDRARAGELHKALLPFEDIDSTHGWGYASYGPVGWALGELSLLLGDVAQAAAHLERVVDRAEAGPYRSVAELRCCEALLELGTAPVGEVLARVDRVAAQFRAWGVDRFAGEAERLLSHHQLVSRSTGNVIAADGDGWRFTYDGVDESASASGRGVRYLVELLSRPGETVPAADLLRLATVGMLGDAVGRTAAEVTHGPGRLGAVIDATARRSYEERITELERSLRRAKRRDERARIVACETELAQLRQELAAGTGFGGRARQHVDDDERARVSVTKAIRRSIQSLYDVAPELAAHLDATVVTGSRCSYGPHPDVREWLVTTG